MSAGEITAAGEIVTFYSYKGGTGRSMALANVACLLAEQLSADEHILMIDWDLEAPGLHRYFRDQLEPRWRPASTGMRLPIIYPA
jgi:MinD superfamily P-loop ATPase